jgi:hypothetical protein
MKILKQPMMFYLEVCLMLNNTQGVIHYGN